MTVKTLTVTEEAYNILKAAKGPQDSFSDTIVRIGNRKPISEFFGALKGEQGERFEKAIMDARKRRNSAHRKRIASIVNAFQE